MSIHKGYNNGLSALDPKDVIILCKPLKGWHVVYIENLFWGIVCVFPLEEKDGEPNILDVDTLGILWLYPMLENQVQPRIQPSFGSM